MSEQTIIHGDCMEYLASCCDKTFDLILTDVPYKQEFHERGMAKARSSYKAINDYGANKSLNYADFFDLCLKKLKRVNFFTFCNKETKYDFVSLAKEHGFSWQELCFCKTAPTPFVNNQWLTDVEYGIHIFKNLPVMGEYRTKRSFFVLPNFKEDGQSHPSAKKSNIVGVILSNISNAGDIVCDPYSGSGATAVACRRLNRSCVGIEINDAYFKDSIRRLEEEIKQPDFFREG